MGRKSTLQRFWSLVKKSPGCWLWTGTRLQTGYGCFHVSMTNLRYDLPTIRVLAHRFSWTHVHGPIPDGLYVLHHCDNPPCVNPDHLFLGTLQDNRDDCVRKGRHAHGRRNGKSVATPTMVRNIRRAYAAGRATTRGLAQRTGLSKSNVWAIVTRQTWKELA